MIARYAHAYDGGLIGELAGLFRLDGRLVLGERAHLVGPAEIEAYLAPRWRAGSFHLNGPTRIESNGPTSQLTTDWIMFRDGRPTSFGRYLDVVERGRDRSLPRFVERRVTYG